MENSLQTFMQKIQVNRQVEVFRVFSIMIIFTFVIVWKIYVATRFLDVQPTFPI